MGRLVFEVYETTDNFRDGMGAFNTGALVSYMDLLGLGRDTKIMVFQMIGALETRKRKKQFEIRQKELERQKRKTENVRRNGRRRR